MIIMNRIILVIAVFLATVSLSSCLKSNTESIDAYNNNNINDIVGVWFRYVDNYNEGTTQTVVKKVELDNISRQIDEEARYIKVQVRPSADKLLEIPKSHLEKLNLNNISIIVALPTAARILPLGGSPKMGVNGDWTKPNKYIVQAANGAKKEWTIEITEFILDGK